MDIPHLGHEAHTRPASRQRTTREKAEEYIRGWMHRKDQELIERIRKHEEEYAQQLEIRAQELERKQRKLAESDTKVEAWRREKTETAKREKERQAAEKLDQERKKFIANAQRRAKADVAFNDWKHRHTSLQIQPTHITKHSKPWVGVDVPTPDPNEHLFNHPPPLLSPPSLFNEYERVKKTSPSFMQKYPALVANGGREMLSVKQTETRATGGPRMHKGKSDFVSKKNVVYRKHHAL
ncbi:hypothetical protein SeMB42_g06463 [Synchytrium endobioticum]|uniref:Uncharacterized protein n=1 Tax=Synchytrium endobioticum TaxID=286115 RepID=A0A507D4U3_9FUNG|nr:hypothetical protein SeMB42_g06463 [Synchytrium endobioticum]TPX46325.1 hypothetical protein SeLEV6574_g03281 [Synchytrium endobioticum]